MQPAFSIFHVVTAMLLLRAVQGLHLCCSQGHRAFTGILRFFIRPAGPNKPQRPCKGGPKCLMLLRVRLGSISGPGRCFPTNHLAWMSSQGCAIVDSRLLGWAGQTLQSLTEPVGGTEPFRNTHTTFQVQQPEVASCCCQTRCPSESSEASPTSYTGSWEGLASCAELYTLPGRYW